MEAVFIGLCRRINKKRKAEVSIQHSGSANKKHENGTLLLFADRTPLLPTPTPSDLYRITSRQNTP